MLLPFDVHRHSSYKMWPYGVQEGAKSGACTAASDVVGIHYVKDKGEQSGRAGGECVRTC